MTTRRSNGEARQATTRPSDATVDRERRPRGMGAITQLPDGRWQGRLDLGWVDGKRKRKAIYGKTKADVEKKLARAMVNLERGTLTLDERQTLGQFLDHWLTDVVKVTVRPKTYESYRRQVETHIKPELGRIALSKLTVQHLAAFYRKMLTHGVSDKCADRTKRGKGLAPSSVNRLHAILHRALDQAVRWNVVVRNVADLVDPPRPQYKEMQPLTREQVQKLFAVAREGRFYALYVLAVTTGMRQSELLGLRWADVDLDRGTIHVRQQLVYVPGEGFSFSEPKTAKGRRIIRLPTLAVTALREHRTRQAEERLKLGPAWENHDLVFPNEVGKPVERNNLVKRSFLPLLEQAGLPRIRFHDLRHTAATLLLTLGENPKVVQERLGHSTIAVTMDVYSHVLPDLQRQAAEKLDTLLGASTGS